MGEEGWYDKREDMKIWGRWGRKDGLWFFFSFIWNLQNYYTYVWTCFFFEILNVYGRKLNLEEFINPLSIIIRDKKNKKYIPLFPNFFDKLGKKRKGLY